MGYLGACYKYKLRVCEYVNHELCRAVVALVCRLSEFGVPPSVKNSNTTLSWLNTHIYLAGLRLTNRALVEPGHVYSGFNIHNLCIVNTTVSYFLSESFFKHYALLHTHDTHLAKVTFLKKLAKWDFQALLEFQFWCNTRNCWSLMPISININYNLIYTENMNFNYCWLSLSLFAEVLPQKA